MGSEMCIRDSLNFALGGNGGAGPVAANFVQDVLEIDYVRVYAN